MQENLLRGRLLSRYALLIFEHPELPRACSRVTASRASLRRTDGGWQVYNVCGRVPFCHVLVWYTVICLIFSPRSRESRYGECTEHRTLVARAALVRRVASTSTPTRLTHTHTYVTHPSPGHAHSALASRHWVPLRTATGHWLSALALVRHPTATGTAHRRSAHPPAPARGGSLRLPS